VPAELVTRTVGQLGALDVLFANAGVGEKLAWDELNLDTWQHTLAVNLTAPWLLTRAALPGMLQRGFGRILYVSSVAALNGGVVGPHYAASKAGLHGLMHHIAARTADHDVIVNTIARRSSAEPGSSRLTPTTPTRSRCPVRSVAWEPPTRSRTSLSQCCATAA
jgi:3-oxoacyl-[acyl-carrier protein] reductase